MQAMLDAGVATRRGIMCAHSEPVYLQQQWSCGAGPGICGCLPCYCERLKKSEKAQDHTILLPLYSQMTEDEQNRVVQTLKEACWV
jgi:dTDP-4-amino-4,6-dideoxygalactose transaminase